MNYIIKKLNVPRMRTLKKEEKRERKKALINKLNINYYQLCIQRVKVILPKMLAVLPWWGPEAGRNRFLDAAVECRPLATYLEPTVDK